MLRGTKSPFGRCRAHWSRRRLRSRDPNRSGALDRPRPRGPKAPPAAVHLPTPPGSGCECLPGLRAQRSGEGRPGLGACAPWDTVTLSVRSGSDAVQVPGPALPPAGQELDAHSQHVGCCGHCGAGVGHRLAADSGLGALHQRQVQERRLAKLALRGPLWCMSRAAQAQRMDARTHLVAGGSSACSADYSAWVSVML
ncbi:Hypothetical predicted protein [Marmota monax]|uniref:Uncharacterized protein n=1 Tax=Marmota monax TaxID=9995 RepID=A0A5E4BGU3_MARMO|nr:Hypothetical predicted protein [Marmota monax]